MGWRVLNTLLWKGSAVNWLVELMPTAEPFEELRRLTVTEINIQKGGYALYRQARVSDPLDERFNSGPFVDPSGLSAAIFKSERIVISIDKSLCFCRALYLPAASTARTSAMLELELSRIMPFPRDLVIATYVDLGGPASDGVRLIEQICVRKDVIAGVVETLAAAGQEPVALTVREGRAPALAVALGPSGRPFRQKTFATGLKLAAMALAAVIVSGAFALWAVATDTRSRAEALDASIATAKNEAMKVGEILEQAKRSSQALVSLSGLKGSRVPVLGAMEELSRLLPDDAYLDGMTIDGKTLTADGGALAPELLIAELEASPLFENVVFAAPVFKNPGEVKSRFSIKLEVSEVPGT